MPITMNAEVDATDGFHRVCLQLEDVRLGRRTVDCVEATTAPPDTVDAEYKDGVLNLRIAKKKAAEPSVRKIDIRQA